MRFPETKEVAEDLGALLAAAQSVAVLDSAHAEAPDSFRLLERLRGSVADALHERRADHGKSAIDATTVKLNLRDGSSLVSSEIVTAAYARASLEVSIRVSHVYGAQQWHRVAWTGEAWPRWIPGPWWSWIDQFASDLDTALDPWRVAVEKAKAEKATARSDAEKRIAAIVRVARKVSP
jgi:hypothetical protein